MRKSALLDLLKRLKNEHIKEFEEEKLDYMKGYLKGKHQAFDTAIELVKKLEVG